MRTADRRVPAVRSALQSSRRYGPSSSLPHTLLRRVVQSGTALLLTLGSASAEVNVYTRVICPPETPRGHPAPLDIRLENGECSAYNVRLMSGFTANANASIDGLSLYGPVHMFETIVPAANCPTLTPTVVELSPLLAYPLVPDALFGAVSSFVVISEWTSGSTSKTDAQQCLIPVPEPSLPVQLVAGVIGLVGLTHLRTQAATRKRKARR